MVPESYNTILYPCSEIVNTRSVKHSLRMGNELGELIAKRMQARGRMTGKDLADRIGKSPSYVSQLINGEKKDTPPPEVLEALDRELGIPIEESLRMWGYDIGTAGPKAALPFDSERAAIMAAIPNLTESEARVVRGLIEAQMAVRENQKANDPVAPTWMQTRA